MLLRHDTFSREFKREAADNVLHWQFETTAPNQNWIADFA